jgi:pimeloyl-ACP methyl ester carboxylesterase
MFPRWRILAPALPGFDGSDLVEPPHIDEYAKHLLDWLDVRSVREAVFGGVSIGGYLMFALLRLAPERVTGVILSNTRSSADSDEARAVRERTIQAVADQGVAAVVPDMLSKLLGPTSQKTRPHLLAEVRRMIEAQTPAAVSSALRVLMTRPDSTPMLGRIRVPALVIAGEEDVIVPLAEMARMASEIRGATFVKVSGAGHLPNLEDPERFNASVSEWLSVHN